MNPNSFWGRQIQARRISLDLTQDALARKVGVTHATVWRWENGWMEPSRRHKTALAEVLGVDVYLLTPETRS